MVDTAVVDLPVHVPALAAVRVIHHVPRVRDRHSDRAPGDVCIRVKTVGSASSAPPVLSSRSPWDSLPAYSRLRRLDMRGGGGRPPRRCQERETSSRDQDRRLTQLDLEQVLRAHHLLDRCHVRSGSPTPALGPHTSSSSSTAASRLRRHEGDVAFGRDRDTVPVDRSDRPQTIAVAEDEHLGTVVLPSAIDATDGQDAPTAGP